MKKEFKPLQTASHFTKSVKPLTKQVDLEASSFDHNAIKEDERDSESLSPVKISLKDIGDSAEKKPLPIKKQSAQKAAESTKKYSHSR